jgi:MurNAc alpha-1-phosphate uridylyltransferase
MITKTAFILAAGKGTRLRPYTDTVPKPMVNVAGKPIIDHIIEKCKIVGIQTIIINVFHLGDLIKKYFKDEDFIFSDEEKILDTGGGVKNALDYIKEDVFFLINGDAFWTEEGDYSTLRALDKAWDSHKMDILLLLQPVEKMQLTEAVGDYDIDEQGRAIRSKNKSGQYMFAGVRLTKKSVFKNVTEDVFSFLNLMDEAEKKGALYALVHEGHWHHISTPDDLKSVNKALGFGTAPHKENSA